MSDFNMPGPEAGYPARGRWLVEAFMDEFSLTENQSGGVVGNPGYESHHFEWLKEKKPIVAGSKGGYGWPQWTGPRRNDYMSWCQNMNLDPDSDQANFGYMVFELHGPYAYVLQHLRKETTIERCVFVFGRLYEAPYGTTPDHLPAFAQRLAAAKTAIAGEWSEGDTEAQDEPEQDPATGVAAEAQPAAPAAAPGGDGVVQQVSDAVGGVFGAIAGAVTSTVSDITDDIKGKPGGKAKPKS